MDDFDNPYQSPGSEELAPGPIPSDSDSDVDPRSIGKAKYVPTVAILMIVHGVLVIVAGFGWIAAMVFEMLHQLDRQKQMQRQMNGELQGYLVYAVFGAISAILLLIGVVGICAGARNYGYRNRTFGVISMVFNMGSVLFCWCLPLSIGLLIFGMIIYLSPEADRAFQWRFSHPQQP